MGTAHFLQLERKDYDSGRWFARLRDEWAAGRVGLVEIAPEPSGDPELRAAIETMLASNGSYEPGDRAVIHARPAALDMAGETALLLRARGVEARIILGMASLGRQVRELVEIARRSVEGAPAGDAREAATHAAAGDADGAPARDASGAAAEAAPRPAAPAGVDPRVASAALDGIQACYRSLLEPIEREGRGHWIVPIGTAPDPEPDCVPALDFFSKAAGRGLAPLGALRVDGRIRSHDIWLYPGELDVRRLNEGLPAERHWTLDEWRALVFRSMAVGADELRRIALGTEAIALTIAASERGGRLHYAREDGTDITYSVRGRPVILDCGRVGVNSLGGTEPYRSAITNQPTTEVFVAPIEDSMDGVIVYTIPERTMHGVIRAPYRIEVRQGRVAAVQAPDGDSLRILRNYTGLEPYDGQALAGEAAEAFAMRRVIAEMAIAGFNPIMLPEIRSGRLRPVTGLVLMDEKLGDHQAFGSNDQFKGAVPSTHGQEHVEHTDFVGGIDRRMRLL